MAVQALPFAVQQELEGLQAVHTVSFIEVGLIGQELSLAALLVDLAFQLPVENTPKKQELEFVIISLQTLTWQSPSCHNHFRNDFPGNIASLQLVETAVGQI